MSTNAANLETVRNLNVRRGRLLEYLTVGWNLIEATVSIGTGFLAGSASLIGFGVDALIESASAATMLWRLQTGTRGEEREQLALKLVGVSFLLLGAYVAYSAIKSLLLREPAEISLPGIAIATLSLVVMPLLARAKRRVAAELNSRAMQADSRQSDLCAYLSAILLVGLSLNALLGWWWADAVAALVMVPIIVREAVSSLRGQTCDDCHG